MSKQILAFLRTTLVGGVIFLLPLALVAWLAKQLLAMTAKASKAVLALMPDALNGVVAAALATVLVVLGVAFIAGLFAQTRAGQRLFQWLENSIVGSLPQFQFLRGIANSIEETGAQTVQVVLVPADAGFALGFVFEGRDRAWVPVFLPAAPQWTSGSIVFAETANVHDAGIDFAKAMSLLKRLGANSQRVSDALLLACPATQPGSGIAPE